MLRRWEDENEIEDAVDDRVFISRITSSLYTQLRPLHEIIHIGCLRICRPEKSIPRTLTTIQKFQGLLSLFFQNNDNVLVANQSSLFVLLTAGLLLGQGDGVSLLARLNVGVGGSAGAELNPCCRAVQVNLYIPRTPPSSYNLRACRVAKQLDRYFAFLVDFLCTEFFRCI